MMENAMLTRRALHGLSPVRPHFCGSSSGSLTGQGRDVETRRKLGNRVRVISQRNRRADFVCNSKRSDGVELGHGSDSSRTGERDNSGAEKDSEEWDGKENSISRGAGEEDKVGRRKALTLSIAVPTAVAIDAAFSGNSHPARALIQTGMERGELKAAGTAVENLKSRVSTFTLNNGMRWIVLERHNAPVVACHTYANVGAANETTGMTGLAHLLEHLAFKGTELVGTRDAEKERVLLDQLDDVFYAMEEARSKGRMGDAQTLKKKFEELQAAAAQFSIPNAYGSLIERQGGIGLNAQTSQDSTEYFVSLPSNKLELWMALESGRFIAPVFREVYSEKEVVKEERRLRVDNTPFGRFTEAFVEAAFPKQPYGRPVIGYPDDFERLGRREVASFFQKNYTPRTLTCAVVGDVDPTEVERLAQRYFGSWRIYTKSPALVSPAGESWRKSSGWDDIIRSDGNRTLRMNLAAQPLYMEGYYRPPASSSDDSALTVVNELLTGGRLSRLYKKVILPGKALSAQSVESFPGDKLPCLLLIYGVPKPGTSTDFLASVLHGEVEALVDKAVKADELMPIKKAARTGLLEAFGSNRAMAKLLCTYVATTDNWQNLLEENELIGLVSPTEVQRAASLLFSPDNRVCGHVMTSGPSKSPT